MTGSFDNNMTGKILIILGSARSDGHTAQIAKRIATRLSVNLIDLKEYQFEYYDYEHKYKNNDFINLIRNEVIEADTIILATPVYWYSMSGLMKVFLDRITDLLDIEKELGRKLRGKSMAVFASSNGDNLGDNFWLPFIHTADYLGMNYLGNAHYLEADAERPDVELDFVNDLLTARSNL